MIDCGLRKIRYFGQRLTDEVVDFLVIGSNSGDGVRVKVNFVRRKLENSLFWSEKFLG